MSDLPFKVTVFDPKINDRIVYGYASDPESAATLIESIKVQCRGLRDSKIEVSVHDAE